MPTYEYACSSCQNQWEEIQKISEPALTVCPNCKNETARRQISGGNFILKGGGWYADLYSSSKPSGGSETKTNGSSSSTSTESKKSEAPAASTASAPAASSTSSAPAAAAKKD